MREIADMTLAAGWDRFLVGVACGLLCAALVLGLAGKRARSPPSPVCAICTIQDKRDAPCIIREAAMRAFANGAEARAKKEPRP
jgi:hypothetical protein